MIKAVGFDLDDTLYDREWIYEKTYAIMEQNVLTTNVSFYDFNQLFQQESIIEFKKFTQGIKNELDYKLDRILATYKKLGQNLTKEQALIFHTLYLYYRERIEIRPGMEKLMKYLQSVDVQLFILTNGAEETQENKLYNLGIHEYILKKHFFISGKMKAAKPDKTVFSTVEASLNLKGNEILYIGDHYETDILGSLQNNWKPVLFNIHNTKIENKSVLQFHSDEQLSKYVKNIISKR